MRSAGIFFACLFGIGVPAFLLGPVLSGGVSIDSISTAALAASVAGGLFGLWLLVVSCLASAEDVKKVVESFQGSEAVLLFLPYLLVVGTKSVWRRLFSGNDGAERRS
jgi:hypothetical protein